MAKKLSKADLHGIVRKTITESDAYTSKTFGFDRVKATYYYQGMPHDKTRAPKAGRSSVVSRDVQIAVDTMMPSLVRVFCSGDQIGQFIPYKPEDAQAAGEATDYINHLWFEANDGYLHTSTWLKSALLYKFSVAKIWWDTTPTKTPEKYEGIPEIEYQALLSEPDLEISKVEVYDDPDVLAAQEGAAIGAVTSSLAGQAPVASPPGTDAILDAIAETALAGAPVGQPVAMSLPLPVPKKYDVEAVRICKAGKLAVAIVPPENFLFPKHVADLDGQTLTHREPTTVSDLVAQGYSRTALAELPDADDAELNEETLARLETLDQSARTDRDEPADDTAKQIWLNESYIRADYNGDGVAEYMLVRTAGPQGEVLLDCEEVDDHPFVAWSPILMPHRLVGEGIASQVADIQEIKTVLLRQMLDNTYLTNNGTMVFNRRNVDPADIYNRMPGGAIRADNPASDVVYLTPPSIVGSSLQTLAYIDEATEQRTGLTRYNQGLDPNEVHNRTAAGVRQLSQAGRERIELVARNFGECGLKVAYKKILKLVKKHQTQPYEIYSHGRWLKGDPTIWRNDFEFSVSVGLGTQDKDIEMSRLMAMLDLDQKIIGMQGGASGPIVNLNNVYAKLSKLVIAAGFKNPDMFYSNPANFRGPMPGEQQQPDPMTEAVIAKTQADIQLERMKAEHRMQLEERELIHSMELEKRKASIQAELEIIKLRAKMELEALETQGQLQVEQAKAFRDVQRDAQKDAQEIAARATA